MRINRNGAQGETPKPQTSPAAPQAPQQPVRRKAFDYEAEEAATAQQRSRPRPRPEPVRQPAPQPVEEYEFYEEDEEETPRRRFPVVRIAFLLVFLAVVGFGVWKVLDLYGEVRGRSELGAEQEFLVDQGTSVAAISTMLEEQGIIENGWLFKLYAQYSGKAGGVQYGQFYLRSGMSYNTIIKTLSVQNVFRETVTVTFPEGSTSVAIAQLMEQNGLCTAQEFLDCANGTDGSDFSQYEFWSQIPDNGRIMKCEGYLFPETYEFYLNDDVYNYVDTFYKQFDKETEGLMETISAKGTTLDEVVIMASFIQEEAGMPEEDARVSACFYNRLHSNDPLWAEHRLESNACSYITNDADNNYLWNSPVAAYMGWVEAGAIPEEILAVYDTYRISGLPAGPISSPGYAAIEAALNPDETYVAEGYYFFVTGHPDTAVAGQYFYAKTADEHYQNCVTAGWA